MLDERRLVPVAVGAWAAAAVGTMTSTRVDLIVAVLAAVMTGATGRPVAPASRGRTAEQQRPRSVIAAVSIAVAFGTSIGAASAAEHLHHLRLGPVPRLAAAHSDVEVVLRLVRDPDPVVTATGARLTITDATVTRVDDDGWRSANSPVLALSYGSGWVGLLPGQRVDVSGRLSPPQRGDDVAAVLDARTPPMLLGRPPWWQRVAGRARSALRVASAGLPIDERGLLPSLVDGDESAVPPDLQGDMRVTGLTHLEAVSGENLSVTLAITLAVARGIGLRRHGRAAVCAVMLVSFVVLARPSPSVLRAAVMGTVAVAAMLLGRRTSTLPALSVAVTVLVVANPFLARSVGFVLSVVATAALVTIAPVWTRRLEQWLPHPVAVAIAVPAAAQLACTPVLIAAFGQLSPYAVPANLVAGIAVVPATILGVLCAVLAAVWVPAGVPLAWLGALPTAWISGTARAFAGLPGAGLHATAAVGLGLAAAGVAIAVGWRVSSRRRDILAAWHR